MVGSKIVLRQPADAAPKKRRSKKTKVQGSPKSNGVPDGQARLNLLLEQDLKDYAKDYADRHHTNITQLIKDFFVNLRKKEKGLDIDQI